MIEQHGSLAEKFIKKGFWLYLFSFIVAPMGYIIKIILSTDLSVEEVGLIYGVISLITLVSAYHDLGVTESINYFVPKFIGENRYDKVKFLLSYGIIIQIITGVIIASFFFFGSNYLALHYFETIDAINILKIFALYFLCVNFFQIISIFFMAIQNTFYSKIVELIRMGFTLLSTLILFFLDYGSLVFYSFAWFFGLIIGTIFSIIFFYKKYYRVYLKNITYSYDFTLFKEILKYSFLVFLGAQATTILGQIDMQMIIYILGTKDAGYYTNYLSIIGIPFMVIGPVFGLLFPVISELYGKKDIEKIRLIKSIFTKNFLSVGLAINILFFIFAEVIAQVLFGEKFIMSGTILKYSVLLLIFNYLLHINFQIMSGIGRVKYKLHIMIIAIVSNVFMNYIFIKSIGVVGASLATGIGWIIIWVLSEYYLGKEYKIKYDVKNFFKNVIIFGIVGVSSYFFALPLISGLSRIGGFFAMIFITIIYIGFFVLTNLGEIKKFVYEIKMVKKTLK